MKIHELKIEGFKSIGSISLKEPNPFSVFVGPNGAGKSNIFEALEFIQLSTIIPPSMAASWFGGAESIFKQTSGNEYKISTFINLGGQNSHSFSYVKDEKGNEQDARNYNTISDFLRNRNNKEAIDYLIFTNFTRLFVKNTSIVRQNVQDDARLASDASNLEMVLKRIFKNKQNKEEIIEILQLLIPGFSNIDIVSEELSGSDNLLIYEDALEKPLTKRLISDGTYNILAIIAAIYQSEEPQFLCIEEPENGLNPKVVRQMVSLFRDKCKEKGHYIWLSTHSQTLVAELTPEEIILVDKVNGNTETKQVKGFDLNGMKMDEALLTNALGGGIPW